MAMKKTPEELRRLMDLRRSNAASPVKNKSKYTRQNNKKLIGLAKKEGEVNE